MDRHFKKSNQPSNPFESELPLRPHLEHLRAQAKELLRAYRMAEPVAIERMNRSHPSLAPVVKLADAQLVVAREYGFTSWPRLHADLQRTNENANLQRAIRALQAGQICILFDDESRENEGDFVLAAEKASADAINFITKHGRGTLCLALTEERAAKIGLWAINRERFDLAEPAFLNSIDARQGITTGVSAFDRAQTVLTAVRDDAVPGDLKSPGHVFPLRACAGGLKTRRGHTEGSVALMQRAGLKPAAVICEILNNDGTMARWPDLERLANEYDLAILKISDVD